MPPPSAAGNHGRNPPARASPFALRRLNEALRLQRRYLIEIKRHRQLQKFSVRNELLKRAARKHEKFVYKLGRAATLALYTALRDLKLCKNLDFWDGFPVKVNANDE